MGPRKKVRLQLSPQAARYVRADAPVEARRMAARGALPLPPLELVTVLYALTHDPDPEAKERARASLEALPDPVFEAALTGAIHPAVLAFLAHLYRERPERLERIALHPQVEDRTLAFLATLPHRPIVELVANNQERLLRAPEIVEALGENPITSRAVIDRILSFLGLERPRGEVGDELADEEPPSRELSDAEAEAALRSVLGDDTSGFEREWLDEDAELSDEHRGNLYARIQQMTVLEKIKLARLGNREARALLVREPNRIVAAAAVRSPKITEQEITAFAKSRNVCDEVIRLIANNREWTRSYAVKLALVTNPKCPQATAMKLLNYLQDRDLRAIMRSKDVPSVVASHARRILSKKGKL